MEPSEGAFTSISRPLARRIEPQPTTTRRNAMSTPQPEKYVTDIPTSSQASSSTMNPSIRDDKCEQVDQKTLMAQMNRATIAFYNVVNFINLLDLSLHHDQEERKRKGEFDDSDDETPRKKSAFTPVTPKNPPPQMDLLSAFLLPQNPPSTSAAAASSSTPQQPRHSQEAHEEVFAWLSGQRT